MESELTSQDRKRIVKGIRGKYVKVAVNPEGLFKYPTGQAGLEALNYDPELIQALPDAVRASYCGVGNPFILGPIHKGDAVLDIGCGAGVDTIVAAMMTGPAGSVSGIEMVPEMLERAMENLRMMGLKNVTFVDGSAEKLPLPTGSFEVVISNGVLNLVIDKARALREAFRVLKPAGRLMMADQILTGELQDDAKIRVDTWSK
ncbi:MAG: methyltransferase domain-containing protein [Deltaproteobacteria bacterium]|nr:methyltransferase domain-containing protein [Deltaproteobacteria bacterium]